MKEDIGVDSLFILFFGLLGEFMLITVWWDLFLLLPMFMCLLNVFMGVRMIRRNYRRYPRADA